MNLTVIGTGYVGLVTAAIFSDFGNKVIGLDIDEKKIGLLKQHQLPFYEPGLEKMLDRNLKNGNLKFTTDYQQALNETDVIFICVGTPSKNNGDYDLSFVEASAEQIGKNLQKPATICIKSTVPPGTNDEVEKIIKKYAKVPFVLASCPEFLREGSAVADSLSPSRIVIGVTDKNAEDTLRQLHAPIKARVLICDPKSAQMIKYAANAFLATKISFINCIARLCDQVGADVKDVAMGLGLDPRIGEQFLDAGLGYGGSCFPKDTWALISFAARLGFDFKFLKEVDSVNQSQVDYLVEKIVRLCQDTIENKTIAILGLSFKANTDDMREARSIPLIRKLQTMSAKINAYDPVAIENAKKVLTNVNYNTDVYQVLTGSSALVLVTEWPEFLKLDLAKAASLMKTKVVIDARNFLDGQALIKMGFIYEGVGRK